MKKAPKPLKRGERRTLGITNSKHPVLHRDTPFEIEVDYRVEAQGTDTGEITTNIPIDAKVRVLFDQPYSGMKTPHHDERIRRLQALSGKEVEKMLRSIGITGRWVCSSFATCVGSDFAWLTFSRVATSKAFKA